MHTTLAAAAQAAEDRGPTGPTLDADDPEYPGSTMAQAFRMHALQVGLLAAQSKEVAERRDEAYEGREIAWEAFRVTVSWYEHQWAVTRMFALVRIVAVGFSLYAMAFESTLAAWFACLFLVGSAGRALYELGLKRPMHSPLDGFEPLPLELATPPVPAPEAKSAV